MSIKYHLMLVALDPQGDIIAKVLVKELDTVDEVDALNQQMLKERDGPDDKKCVETKFVQAVQNLIETKHGPRCRFALERLMILK